MKLSAVFFPLTCGSALAANSLSLVATDQRSARADKHCVISQKSFYPSLKLLFPELSDFLLNMGMT